MTPDEYARIHLGTCAACANATRNAKRATDAHEAQARVANKVAGSFVGLTVREAVTWNA